MYVTDNPVVPDPVAPEPAEGTGQRFPDATRIRQLGDAFVHIIDDAVRYLLILTAKLV